MMMMTMMMIRAALTTLVLQHLCFLELHIVAAFSVGHCHINIDRICYSLSSTSTSTSNTSRRQRQRQRQRYVYSTTSVTMSTEESNHNNNNNPRGVERVSICMGELCKCQEEGNNADAIMDTLLTTKLDGLPLPFIVEDAPCLGACGQGSMVSIDYEDGDFALVTGLQETMDAIGMDIEMNGRHEAEAKAEEIMMEEDVIVNELVNAAVLEMEGELVDNNMIMDSSSTDDDEEVINTTAEKEELRDEATVSKTLDDGTGTGAATTQIIAQQVEKEHGAVGRMRNEALQDTERVNPWVNMAMYIGKKVKDSVVG